MVVQHNLTAMNSNRMLGLTTASQAKSTERLSSGYKINRAADDAAGLSISEKMRKQIRGLTQASLNAQDGISEVHDMLQRMNELAVKAANGTNSESDRSYIQDEIDQLVTEIDRVSETTKFNETYLLKGDNTAQAKINFQYKAGDVTSEDLYYVEDHQTKMLAKGNFKSAVDEVKARGIDKFYSTGNGATLGEAISSDSGSSAYFEDTVSYIAEDVYSKNAAGEYYLVKGEEYQSSASSSLYHVTFDSNGGVGKAEALTADPTTSDDKYKVKSQIYDENGNPVETGTLIASSDSSKYYSALGKGFIDTNKTVSEAYETSTVQFTDKDGNEIAANGLEKYFNQDGTFKADSGLMKKVGDDLVAATGEDVDNYVNTKDHYSVGALTMVLHVGADATENNQISVELDAMSAEGLGIKGISVAGGDDTNARNAIETLSAAIQRVSTQRSALGAVQNRLEHTINNLDNIVENTTSAESQIRDTDMATEMVKYSNNNILAQAGQAMLAQANQSNQGVLSLLG